ncbi:hypothetical protein OG2516_08356 [Oceanicola granulosus HTCC2516]|uniref:Uncharacterized protein n=1 Tax=Oceanicola granulosus (strain ATCC BAA-861 / DSM 15982 / KCTC 12143 / HTCC2516) TaxID=314256 RepID=Q2CBK9_OCEGH|nr:hypothetical protein [Oceanicola granulosus]EAR50036.1 hypothetical protein OG2516_08356 [Oceanicola granulosus HTCC2516]
MIRRPLLAALALLPLPLAAETVLVDNLSACEGYHPDTEWEGMLGQLMGEQNTVLTAEFMAAIEWTCEYDAPIEFDWRQGAAMQIRPGYCMEPGPFVYPTVFVFGMFPDQTDRVYVWQTDPGGTGEPHVFHVCPAAP